MIDKNGKLFGKINIIDLLIILIIIAAIVLLIVRGLGGLGGGEQEDEELENLQKVRVTFYGNWVNDFLPDSIAVGDPCTQYSTEIDFGKLTGFSSEPAYSYQYDETHQETVKLPAVGYCFLTFTCDCVGVLDEVGLTMEGTTFVVGGNYYINIGPTRTGCQIKAFEPLGKLTEKELREYLEAKEAKETAA